MSKGTCDYCGGKTETPVIRMCKDCTAKHMEKVKDRKFCPVCKEYKGSGDMCEDCVNLYYGKK